jgi:hypothetical protein
VCVWWRARKEKGSFASNLKVATRIGEILKRRG